MNGMNTPVFMELIGWQCMERQTIQGLGRDSRQVVVLSNLVRKSSLRRFEQRALGSAGVGHADILRKAS